MEVTLATEANLNNQGCLRFSSSPVFSKSQGFKMIFDFAVVFNSCLVIKKKCFREKSTKLPMATQI